MDKQEIVLRYEKIMNSLFRKLEMNGSVCRLVRALIIASNGKRVFEISHREIADFVAGRKSKSTKSDVENVRYSLNALKKWQEEHRIELVKIKDGARTQDRKGRFTYHKTKYEFSAMEGIVNLLFSDSDEGLEIQIKEATDELKRSYRTKRRKKTLHPRYSVRMAKKTIHTKLKKIFSLAQSIEGLNPVEYCNLVLNESKTILENLEKEHLQKLNRKKRMEKFENRLSCADSDT